MAVSIRELLGDVRSQLNAVDTPDAETALAVVAGLAPIGRALDHLYGHRPYSAIEDESQPTEVATLTHACLDASRCWPHAEGRVADLIGATADTIGRRTRTYTHEQRWALSETLAETARRCTDTALRFAPYASSPQLTAVRAAAVACERRAALLPASASDRTALDHLVPARHLTAGAGERIVDAAAALHLALTGGRYYPRLAMAEMVLTLNAAQLATSHAAAVLRETSSEGSTVSLPGLAAPDAWRAARTYCASFDDGTKLRPPDESRVASAAARLGRALLEHLGAAAAPHRQATPNDPRLIDALQTVAGLLPDVAASLGRATRTWAANRQLWAPERRLLSYEERNEAVTTTDGAAVVENFDIEPLSGTLRIAATLTTALATELAAVTEPTRLPHLTEAHAAATGAARYLSIQAQSAHDAVRRAQLLSAEEWALPVLSRVGRASPRR